MCGCSRTQQVLPRLRLVALVCLFLYHTRVIKSLTYGLAAGVPGELRGWERLHTKYGKLPWAKLFEGAIKLARDGFTVNQDLAANLDDSGRTGYSQLH